MAYPDARAVRAVAVDSASAPSSFSWSRSVRSKDEIARAESRVLVSTTPRSYSAMISALERSRVDCMVSVLVVSTTGEATRTAWSRLARASS